MEGDAVGGAINIVIRESLTVLANLGTGYSELFLNRPFGSFDAKNIRFRSPYGLAVSTRPNRRTSTLHRSLIPTATRPRIC